MKTLGFWGIMLNIYVDVCSCTCFQVKFIVSVLRYQKKGLPVHSSTLTNKVIIFNNDLKLQRKKQIKNDKSTKKSIFDSLNTLA
jgi:hypothetical protein